jgi:hypothetical protein
VFAEFWKPHHVDFERVVLDGSDAALAMAAAQPVFFAGLILRGGKVDPDTVKNFAPLPVYVAGDPKLKEALTAAGHPNVTAGPASGLPEWLAKLPRRKIPAEFTWKMRKPDQLLAHWVSIEPDPAVGERTLLVKSDIVTNQIRIEASGIQELTVFLNDAIVDLDREVELIVNGHTEKKQKLDRSFDQLLDKDPISIRRSLYLGWLFPAVLGKITVRPPETKPAEGTKPGDTTAPDAPPGEAKVDEITEERAQNYWTKAAELEAAGNFAEAKTWYAKVASLGNTSLKTKAEEKVKELDGK